MERCPDHAKVYEKVDALCLSVKAIEIRQGSMEKLMDTMQSNRDVDMREIRDKLSALVTVLNGKVNRVANGNGLAQSAEDLKNAEQRGEWNIAKSVCSGLIGALITIVTGLVLFWMTKGIH